MALLRQMLPANPDGSLLHTEFIENHPGTEGETYERLKARLEFRILLEQQQKQLRNAGINAAEEHNLDNTDDHDHDTEQDDIECRQLLVLIDSGSLSEEQVNVLHAQIQRLAQDNQGRGHADS